MIVSGCAQRRRPSTTPPARPPAPTSTRPLPTPSRPPGAGPVLQGQTGIASWYGHPYHGRRTASGEIYNMNDLTAAHRTLPFQTRVRVHNLENGRDVTVRVNDRGPFVEGRIIDLSFAAAQAIEMASTALVRLEVLGSAEPGGPRPAGYFGVQIGSFQDRRNAEMLAKSVEKRFGPVMIQQVNQSNGIFYRLVVGREPTKLDANELARKLVAEGFAMSTLIVGVE
ncbi:MAG: septal ring lytic transglycosylase RlpA family protein [Acidobacteria bacterium]|nr:septal ring lytic transglycosylase RlpA family protein [Acidobacteriota bacterium]